MTEKQREIISDLEWLKFIQETDSEEAEALQEAINGLAALYINYPNWQRPCKACKHYVVTDVKHNYDQGGCGTYDQKIYGCRQWECNFVEKEDNANG